MKKIHLTIPQPCHENWQMMTAAEKGKFCGACQKNVYDFTKATDREIIQAYSNDQKLCGRFLNTQLDRELIIPKEKKSIWLASLFFGMLSVANSKAVAQEKPKTEQTETKHFMGKPAQTQEETLSEMKTISGIVTADFGAFPGVIVVVKGTQRGVSTDFDGKYSIKAKEGETLVFSFMGMEDVSKVVESSNIINVFLKDDSKNISTGIVVCEFKKRTFVGRQFQKIKSWFR